MMSRGRMALGIGIAAGALVMFTSFSNPPAQAGRLVDQASAAPFTPVQAWELRRTIFGDDSSEWANDGECDDPRFFGEGMATDLGTMDVGRDASDCRALLEAGRIAERNPLLEMAATTCSTIDFGDNSSEWANDGVCDDPRFAGFGVDHMLLMQDRGRDADDCRHLCSVGWVWLRSE